MSCDPMNCDSEFYQDFVDLMTECLEEFDCRKNILFIPNDGKIVDGEFVEDDKAGVRLIGVTAPYSKRLVNETTVQTGDIRLIIDSSVKVNQKGSVLLDGDSYSIEDLAPYNVGGILMGYQLQLRR